MKIKWLHFAFFVTEQIFLLKNVKLKLKNKKRNGQLLLFTRRQEQKQKIAQNKKPLPRQQTNAKKGGNRNYYKYGDDEYDNDDYDDDTIDYDRQTTKSDLSSGKSRSSLIDSKHKSRNNRLLDKALQNQHQKNLQQQKILQNAGLSSSSSSTILLLQQSHLVSNNINNLNQITSNNNNNNRLKTSELNLNLEEESDKINYYSSSMHSSSSTKSWSEETSENSKLLKKQEDNLDKDKIIESDDEGFTDYLNNNLEQEQVRLLDEIEIKDISNPVKASDLNEISLSQIDTPKLVNSKSSIEDFTSDNNANSYSEETTTSNPNSKRLAYRKRNNHLNQSLNETDLIINSANNRNKQKSNKRKLKQRKIDLNEQDEYTYEDDNDEEYNSDDANAIKNLNKTYLNYRSLQKSKRSIKSIEQTIKNSRSIEKWLNDFDKIKELDQPTILESPVSTIKPSDSSRFPNDDLYKLLSDLKQEQISPNLPNNKLNETILNLLELNSNDSVKSIELEMFNSIRKFVLPKSLANADDINYLKWFLNDKNFSIILEQPILNSLNQNFLVQAQNINIKLDEEITSEQNEQFYIKYSWPKKSLVLLGDKVKEILCQEKKLAQTTNINNQGILQSFRETYIDTANFNGVQCLMSICKKNANHKKLNSSSCSSSTSSTPVLNTSNTDSNLLQINYSDLNDKIFLCFLSNFSCKLVENFLAHTNTQSAQVDSNSAGFIRKHKFDKSFSYVNLVNQTELKNSNFKLCLKLNKWPSGFDFVQRINYLDKRVLDYLEKNACLISLEEQELDSSFEEEEENTKWQIDTRLAETVIFRSLNKLNIYLYFFLYSILNNLKSLLDGQFSAKNNEFKISSRILFHHYLRYLELNSELNKIKSLEHLSKFYVNFSVFLRTNVLNVYKSINKPNYFNLNCEIGSTSLEISDLDEFGRLLSRGEGYFRNLNNLSKFCENSLQIRSLGVKYKANGMFNQYLMDFFQILFEQFKSKRDHFKINEQVLVEIHNRVIRSNENLNSILISSQNEHEISAGLLSKFEMYAECVHKYLPQIRQHNQYLLFHYIWTMQVQYLAPFFNYICDLYKAYD